MSEMRQRYVRTVVGVCQLAVGDEGDQKSPAGTGVLDTAEALQGNETS